MKLVLVVEDEYGNAEVLQILLEGEGYRVALASNGKAALELLREGEKPSLIISDFMMPIMNGGELGTAVRQDPALRHIPFIFMTATSDDVVQRSFRDYDALVVKPFDMTTLMKVAARLIDGGRPGGPDPAPDAMREVLNAMHVPPRS